MKISISCVNPNFALCYVGRGGGIVFLIYIKKDVYINVTTNYPIIVIHFLHSLTKNIRILYKILFNCMYVISESTCVRRNSIYFKLAGKTFFLLNSKELNVAFERGIRNVVFCLLL